MTTFSPCSNLTIISPDDIVKFYFTSSFSFLNICRVAVAWEVAPVWDSQWLSWFGLSVPVENTSCRHQEQAPGSSNGSFWNCRWGAWAEMASKDWPCKKQVFLSVSPTVFHTLSGDVNSAVKKEKKRRDRRKVQRGGGMLYTMCPLKIHMCQQI